jgi:hypothetical protein
MDENTHIYVKTDLKRNQQIYKKIKIKTALLKKLQKNQ